MTSISPALADRMYGIMVETIGAPHPDEYPWRHWSFCYAISEVKAKFYILDSKLGSGAKFIVNEGQAPTIAIDPSQETEYRIKIMAAANRQIRLAYDHPRRGDRDSSMKSLTAFAENELGLGPEIAKARVELAADKSVIDKLVVKPIDIIVKTKSFEEIFASV